MLCSILILQVQLSAMLFLVPILIPEIQQSTAIFWRIYSTFYIYSTSLQNMESMHSLPGSSEMLYLFQTKLIRPGSMHGVLRRTHHAPMRYFKPPIQSGCDITVNTSFLHQKSCILLLSRCSIHIDSWLILIRSSYFLLLTTGRLESMFWISSEMAIFLTILVLLFFFFCIINLYSGVF